MRIGAMLEAVKERIPPAIRKCCGRLWFFGCAVVGLLTFVSVLGAFSQQINTTIGKNGFWPSPPTTTPPFSGLFQGRCVSLFQGASLLTQKFPATVFLYSYYNAYAFLGVCTNASMQDVDSIFGTKNRMFATRTPDISQGSPEQQFVVFGKEPESLFDLGPIKWFFGIYNPYFHSVDTVCTTVADAKGCCAGSSGACAAAFTDAVPQGFNSVSFWKSYIGFEGNLFDSYEKDSGCNKCGMHVTENVAVPLCDSKAGLYPLFYWSSSLPFFYYIHYIFVQQIIQIVFEVSLVVLVLAKKFPVGNLVCGTLCPFFFALFTWLPCSPLYIDTGSEDNFDPSAPILNSQRYAPNADTNFRAAIVVRAFDLLNSLQTGIVCTGLQLSGGCSSFPGRSEVVALLVFNIIKFSYHVFPLKMFSAHWQDVKSKERSLTQALLADSR
jgi:hypothetical protein